MTLCQDVDRGPVLYPIEKEKREARVAVVPLSVVLKHAPLSLVRTMA